MFPTRRGSKLEQSSRDVCWSGCPILERCQSWGLEHEDYGTWGGLTEWDREHLRKLGRRHAVALSASEGR